MPKTNLPVEFLTDYANYIKGDYIKWWGARASEKHVQEMIEDFTITFEPGSSYIKVVKANADGSQASVHSFIVNKAGKFPLGTILKSAGWKTPATNFARGKLLDRQTWNRVTWTGCN
jgi:hypothetical protein